MAREARNSEAMDDTDDDMRKRLADADAWGSGPGRKRRVTTAVRWDPSAWARMQSALQQGETADVTGD